MRFEEKLLVLSDFVQGLFIIVPGLAYLVASPVEKLLVLVNWAPTCFVIVGLIQLFKAYVRYQLKK